MRGTFWICTRVSGYEHKPIIFDECPADIHVFQHGTTVKAQLLASVHRWLWSPDRANTLNSCATAKSRGIIRIESSNGATKPATYRKVAKTFLERFEQSVSCWCCAMDVSNVFEIAQNLSVSRMKMRNITQDPPSRHPVSQTASQRRGGEGDLNPGLSLATPWFQPRTCCYAPCPTMLSMDTCVFGEMKLSTKLPLGAWSQHLFSMQGSLP